MKNFIFILLVIVSSATKADTDLQNPIIKEYNEQSKKFITMYLNGDSNAYEPALNQLSLDPSDSLAFLRLAISIPKKNCKDFEDFISEFRTFDSLTEVSLAIIYKKCKIKRVGFGMAGQ